MMMTTIAMRMAVIYFCLCRVAFFRDLNIEMQRLPRERMIAVNKHFLAQHIYDAKQRRARFIAGAKLKTPSVPAGTPRNQG